VKTMLDNRPMIIQCQSCLTVYDANSSRGFRIDRCPKCGNYNWKALEYKENSRCEMFTEKGAEQ
jgi:Zn finger protein HypA/HybF involved in hydrogenase expression